MTQYTSCDTKENSNPKPPRVKVSFPSKDFHDQGLCSPLLYPLFGLRHCSPFSCSRVPSFHFFSGQRTPSQKQALIGSGRRSPSPHTFAPWVSPGRGSQGTLASPCLTSAHSWRRSSIC